MQFSKFIFLFFLVYFAGCGTIPTEPPRKQMRVVLNECDRGQSFDLFVICIKNTYQAQGTTPNSPVVRAFYSNLDMINESYANKTVTQAQAMSYAYDSYMRTIHIDNARSDAAFINMMQMLQQQNILQQQRAPVQTNCIRNGPYTNCTSN